MSYEGFGLFPGKNQQGLWNLYDISPNNVEHKLYDSLICEFCDIAGFPIEYYVSIPENDQLYGENPTMELMPSAITKLMYEPTEETTILEAFGITSDETLQYAVFPKTTYTRDLSATFDSVTASGFERDIIQPKPGDIIKTLWNNRNYEIVDVGAEQQVFHAKKFIWELILRPFRYSEETDAHEVIHKGLNTDIFDTSNIPIAEAAEGFSNEVPSLSGVTSKEYSDRKFGDNTWIEDESNKIDDYDDVDTKYFGF